MSFLISRLQLESNGASPDDPREAPARGRWRLGRLLGAFVLTATGIACAASPSATPEPPCAPDKPVFCRCQDRREGQKVCKNDGSGFGRCEPCESFDNPEDTDFSHDDFDGFDGGKSDAGKSVCGNGIVERGEDCDVKNTDPNQGCDKNCKLSGLTPFATNACPGLPVHLWSGDHIATLVSKTTGSGNRSAAAACGAIPATGSTGPDRVFKIVPHATGKLEVAVTEADYNVFLWASAECGIDRNPPLACANTSSDAGGESLVLDVEDGKPIHVFVDGTGSRSSGGFKVTFSIVN